MSNTELAARPQNYARGITLIVVAMFVTSVQDVVFKLFSDGVPLGQIFAIRALLAAPLTVLHAPDCKGLCQVCGHDLNEGPCEHLAQVPIEEIDDALGTPEGLAHARQNPFAALRKDGKPAPAQPPAVPRAEPGTGEGAGLGRLVLSLERKGHGGKSVVRVEGDLGPVAGRKELARELGRALGRGARIDGDGILIQGAALDAPCDWFERRGARQVVRGTR